MKKVILTAFIAGLSLVALESNAQSGRDEQGSYRYETRQERVWIPEQRTGGIFGVGGRTIPGHYETRDREVKVYTDQNGNPVNQNGDYDRQGKGWEGKHPHGMPPGQRKKQGQSNDNRNGNYDRNNDGVIDARDRVYDRNNDGVIDQRDYERNRDNRDTNNDGRVDSRDRNYDRNNDGVIDDRDRNYDRDNRDSRDRRNRDNDDDDDDDDNRDNKKDKKYKSGKKNKKD